MSSCDDLGDACVCALDDRAEYHGPWCDELDGPWCEHCWPEEVAQTVIVFHRLPTTATYEEVYRYTTARVDLEEIWRDNNIVDGTEYPYEFGFRSLMVGDVVAVQGLDDAWRYWIVERLGWHPYPTPPHVRRVSAVALDQRQAFWLQLESA